MRRLLPLLLLLAAPAVGRVKIDRYEPATLPTVRLWVTLLDRDRPVGPSGVKSVTVYIDGQPVASDAEIQDAKSLAEPLALGIVVDARLPAAWRETQRALETPLRGLPEETRAFAVIHHDDRERLPKDGFAARPEDLPPSLRDVPGGGSTSETHLWRAIRTALESFPLAPGVEPERDEVLPPEPKKDDPPFPRDRVVLVVGDGWLETTPSDDVHARLRDLVDMARRRGVRLTTVGVADEAHHLWTLEVLARKTGGTYRRAAVASSLGTRIAEAFEELDSRLVIDAEAPALRRGDRANFTVKVELSGGAIDTSREYGAAVENVLGFWRRRARAIRDAWERWPWWARGLVVLGVVLVVALVLLVVLVKKARKRRAARQEAADSRAAALAARKPCPVCGAVMMPDWKECLFCARNRAAEQPMRFRLTGRSGIWAGQVRRFQKDLVTLGAAPSCDIQVLDRGVQAEHCGIRDRGDEFLLTDFATDAGTWLNGQRVTQAQIDEGDVIRVGECEFVFGIEG